MGGELPISSSEILAYARIHGFETDLQFFYRVVTECDSEFFEFMAKKRKAEKPAKAAKKASRGRK